MSAQGSAKVLTVKHKTDWKNICTELLQQRQKDRDVLLSRIITNDETWVHNYDPLTKRHQNCIISCHHARKNSTCRLLQIMSWLAFSAMDLVSGILGEGCHNQFTAICMQTLKKLEQQTQWVLPNTNINHVLPCMTMPGPTPVWVQGRQLHQWDGLFFLIILHNNWVLWHYIKHPI